MITVTDFITKVKFYFFVFVGVFVVIILPLSIILGIFTGVGNTGVKVFTSAVKLLN